jgi:hypothetical protein
VISGQQEEFGGGQEEESTNKGVCEAGFKG